VSAELRNTQLDQLHPHPDNPRLQLREDVIERLVPEIDSGGFGAEHAILVRPHGDGYQVISGHHRLEAAKRAGLTEVPCWVREMDDDEAFMQLVLGNTQGELSPLEIGMHALKAVPLAQGKSGGGLKAYAERLGRTGEYVGQLRSAAAVVASLPNLSLEVADRAKHLYEISKAPRETWSALVDSLVKRAWSLAA
jgi:ParB/RepB/Spo0J family partition protein